MLWKKGVKPNRIPIGCIVFYFSDFADFSHFEYKFRRIRNLYHLSATASTF